MPQNTPIEIGNVVGHMKKKGSFKIVTIGFILGLGLLLIGSFAFGDKEKANTADESPTPTSESLEEYKAKVISEIEDICLGVDGVVSIKAAVYFEDGGGSIYAQNTHTGSSEKKEYVIIGSGSDSHALYLGESLPRVSGIGIVCDTDGRADVRNELSLLLSSLYGLPLTRVYVCEG
jgi:hypothetical protein